jgi:hypothetical protein
MNRYNIYDMNCSLPRIITYQTHTRNDGKGFTTLLEKDGEWVRYEDTKELKLQVAALTAQLDEKKTNDIKRLQLKEDDVLNVKLNCIADDKSMEKVKQHYRRLLDSLGRSNTVMVTDIRVELDINVNNGEKILPPFRSK